MANHEKSKEKLLAWVSESTGESVKDFTSSWFDGKVLASLLYRLVPEPHEANLNNVKHNFKIYQRLEYVLKTFGERLGVQQLLRVDEIAKKEVDENCMKLFLFLIFKASQAACNPAKSNGQKLQSQSSTDNDTNWKQAFKKWGKKEIDFQKAIEVLERSLKSVGDVNQEKIIRSNLFLVYDTEVFKLQCDGNLKKALALYQQAYKLYEKTNDETEKEILKQKILIIEKLQKHAISVETSEKKFTKKLKATISEMSAMCDKQNFSDAKKFYFTEHLILQENFR